MRRIVRGILALSLSAGLATSLIAAPAAGSPTVEAAVSASAPAPEPADPVPAEEPDETTEEAGEEAGDGSSDGEVEFAIADTGEAGEVEPDAVAIVSRPSEWVFSPNGDNYEDTQTLAWQLSEPATVTVRITDGGGATVRTLIADEPSGTSVDAVWDGRDDFGSPAAEGLYKVELTAKDARGGLAQASTRTGIRNQVPGSWTAPADGSAVSGIVDLVATPTAGVTVSGVSFQLPGAGCCGWGSPADDGTWRYSDDSTTSASGRYAAAATIYWTDELGAGHGGYSTPPVNLVVDNPIRITSTPSEWVFSPNGDGYEDAQSLTWQLSEPATVTALVTDAGGLTVRSLLVDQPAGTSVGLSWDGLDDSGVLAADGLYTITFTARDAQGDVADSTTRTGIRQQIPATWSSPANGATVSGTIDLVVTPAPGVDVSGVGFQPLTGWCCRWGELADDGTWRTTIDTTQIPTGTYSTSATVYWTDELGAGHGGYPTPTVNLLVDNPIRITSAPSESVFSPNGDGYEDAQSLSWQASEPATVTALISDADGATIRTLLLDQPMPASISTSWDGLNDAGAAVADGVYVVALSVRNAQGDVAQSSVRTSIRRQAPAVWTAPATGSTVSGTVDLVVTPTPGVTVTTVSFQSPESWWCCRAGTLAEDGTWRYSFDSDQLSAAAYQTSALVYWTDEFGTGHGGYRTPPVEITIDNPIRITNEPDDQSFSPNGDGYEDLRYLTWYLSEPATVSATVTDAGGAFVRALATDQATDSAVNLVWDGHADGGAPLPEGTYTIDLTVRDTQGDTATASTRTAIRNQVPATWTSPGAGSTISGAVDLVVTPTPDVNVTGVYFQPPGSWGGYWPGVKGPDGRWRYHVDTRTISAGITGVSAYAYWIDEFGTSHGGYLIPAVQLTVDNPVRVESAAQERTFSPNGDGYDDTLSLDWRLSEPTTVTALITDVDGVLVRTLLDGQPSGSYVSATWDGLDDFGVPAEQGRYTIALTARDAQGDTAKVEVRTAIRMQLPGTWTGPANGSTVSGTVTLVATPAPGVTVSGVSFQPPAGGCCYGGFLGPDGAWRYTVDTGSIPPGTYPVSARFAWTDEFGAWHAEYSTPQAQLTVDNTAPVAVLTADPTTGPAPLATKLTIDASDPSDRPVNWSLTFGDGVPAATGRSFAPYDTIPVAHTYPNPGTYTAHLVVTDGAGNQTSSTVQVQVAPPIVNDPPTIAMVVDQTAGAAPFTVSARIDASDPNGDSLRYTVDFGDGTPRLTEVTSGVPVSHTYPVPGRYVLRASVSDGLQTRTVIERIAVVLPEPLAAAAGDDRVVTAGDPVLFDAAASRPQGLALGYTWDFGDGSTGSGTDQVHTYPEPGTYQVTLTATLGADSAADQATVTVLPVPVEPGLAVTVRSAGSLLGGAEVTAILATGERIAGVTDGAGSVRLHGLPDGGITVYVWATGYRPTAAVAELVDGSGSLDVTLDSGEVATSQIESRPLTVEEIVQAGIDVSDPANVSVYEFEIYLNIDGFEGSFSGYSCSSECGGGGGGGGGSWDGWIVYDGVTCEGSCTVTTNTGHAEVSVHWVPGAGPVAQYLVIPGEARFLKEFFDVSLVVQNLTPAPFAFTDGHAALTVPAGLSLAPTATTQRIDQAVEDIQSGQSRTTHWILRGDTEGEYDLSATYTGTVAPIGRPIRLEAQSTSKLKVWGASALTMLVDADAQAYLGHPYNVRVGLKNVSDHPVYNAALELKTKGAQNYIYQPRENLTQSVATIAPGDTFWADYLLVPTIEGNLDLSDSFVLHTAGDVDLADELMSHPPAQTPATAPKVRTYGYGTRVVFDWDAVPGADAYQVFRTPARDVMFGPDPVAVNNLSGSPTRAWTPLTPGEEPFWAISPTVSGTPFMRHALFQASADQEYPKVSVTKDCTGTQQSVDLEFFDPIFDLKRIEVTRDGQPFDVAGSGSLGGHPDKDGGFRHVLHFTVKKADLDLEGDEFTVKLYNDVDEESRTSTFNLRSACLRYAALGDSFSSGEGVYSFDWRTVDHPVITAGINPISALTFPTYGPPLAAWIADNDPTASLTSWANIVNSYNSTAGLGNSCHRSSKAYPALIMDHFEPGSSYDSVTENPSESFLFAACSNAVTANVLDDPQFDGSSPDVPGGEAAQIETLSAFVGDGTTPLDFVTIGIGGNDFEFPQIVKECLGLGSCASNEGKRKNLDRVYGRRFNLELAFRSVKEAAGGRPIFVLGYPDLVSDDAISCFGMNEEERRFASDTLVPFMNSVIKTAAAHEGVTFVDTTRALYGDDGVSHRVCDDDEWASGLSAGFPYASGLAGAVGVGSRSYHPNAKGHQGIFREFMRQVGDSALTRSNPAEDRVSEYPTVDEALGVPSGSMRIVALSVSSNGVTFDSVGRVPDRDLTITTVGLAPNSTVRYEIHSDPVALGSTTADTAGVATFEATIPADVPDGIHNIVVSGTSADGVPTGGTVVVDVGNAVPSAFPDWAVASRDQAVEIAATANDLDPEGGALTAQEVTLPSHGTAVLTADGHSIRYTANSGFCGTDTFDYRVSDGTSLSDPSVVTVLVTCDSTGVVAADDTATAIAGINTEIEVLANDSATGTTIDPATLTITTPPARGTAAATGGRISYTATADARGPDTVTYRICDTAGACDTADLSIDVLAPNGPPTATPDTATTPRDTPVRIDVLSNDSDPDGDPLSVRVVEQPAHGMAAPDAEQAAITYTPDPAFCGPDSFTYAAADGTHDSVPATVTVNVTCPATPPSANADAAETDEDKSVLIDVVSNDTDPDGDLDPASVSVTTGAEHGTAVPDGRGGFAYTPSANYHGPDSFTYQVCDAQAACAAATVAVTVRPMPDDPVAADDSAQTDEDTPVDIPVVANDGDADGEPLTVSVVAAPAHGDAAIEAETLRYSPAPDWHGTDSLVYRVCDPTDRCATASVAVQVRAVNDVPVAVPDGYSTARGTDLVVAAPGLLGNDTDIDGDALTARQVTPPAAGSVTIGPDGSLTYRPADSACGIDTFGYAVDDGSASSEPAPVTVEIRCPQLPFAADDQARLVEDSEHSIDVLANDTGDRLDPATLAVVADPAHGGAVVQDDRILYTPNTDWHGTDVLTYRICDGAGDCATATVAITVTPVNDIPVARPDRMATGQDSAVSIPVLANDADVDGDTLQVGITAVPRQGTATVTTEQSVTYTPQPGFCGVDTFEYRVHDGSDFSGPAVVTVDVTCVNRAPTAVDDTLTVAEDGVGTADVLANDTDDRGLAAGSLQIVGTPADGSADVLGGMISVRPAPNFAGSATVVYQICDEDGLCSRATLSVTVTPVNDPPVCQDLVAMATVGQATIVTPSCADVDGDRLTVFIPRSPANASATVLPDGRISITARRPGTVIVGYAARDSSSTSTPASITLTVRPQAPSEPLAPTAAPAPFPGVGSGQLRLVWLPPARDGGSTITDYVVQLSTTRDTGWQTVNDGTSRLPTAKVSGLINGTRYYLRVAAVNAGGAGAWSRVVTAVPRTTPSAPASPTAKPRDRAVGLTWTAPASTGGSAITDYVVQFSRDGRSWETARDGVSTAIRATVSGLTNGRTYSFRVAARNEVGLGPWTTVITATPKR